MCVLPDHWISGITRSFGMIAPFADNRDRLGRISFGVSSYGYDFRLAEEFKIPDFSSVKCLDPKKMSQVAFREVRAPHCTIGPNSFILGRSLEYFRIPRDVLVLCQGKSTYARCGLIVNVTPFEPEWEGYVTVSLVNAAPVPVKVYAGEGIAQLVFLRCESECQVSYADRSGKYQTQNQIQISKV